MVVQDLGQQRNAQGRYIDHQARGNRFQIAISLRNKLLPVFNFSPGSDSDIIYE